MGSPFIKGEVCNSYDTSGTITKAQHILQTPLLCVTSQIQHILTGKGKLLIKVHNRNTLAVLLCVLS